MRFVDLHVHSLKSDGSFSPAELVDYAHEKGLVAFALTDHDTVDGLSEAIHYADQLRKQETEAQNVSCSTVPKVIPGIELSTEYQGRDIHIVGLYINYESPIFQSALHHFLDSRNNRNRKMCELLQNIGIDISYEKMVSTFPDAVITRAHFAQYLLQNGYISHLKEAFERYIGDRAPCFVPREKVSPAQAIQLILSADGIPILAHPILYHMSNARLEQLISELKSNGLMGIEAIYSTYSPAEERQICRLADKYHLLISGGSDFHGSNKPGLDMGSGYGNLKVPYSVLHRLNGSLRNLLFSDIDGTLLRNDNTLSEVLRTALSNMTNIGHRLILTSGRPLPAILDLLEETNLSLSNMLLIANNGGLIYDCANEKTLFETRISQEDVNYIISKAQKAGIHIHGYTKTHIVALHMNEELKFYTKRIHMPIKYVSDIATTLKDGSYKLQMIHLSDHDALERFRLSLQNYCGDRIQMVFSNDYYLEILPKNADKGQALRFVTNYLAFPHSHTFAIGDAHNDISMLQAANTGIAMSNAKDDIKSQADFVTQRSNEEDGLLEIIEQFFT